MPADATRPFASVARTGISLGFPHQPRARGGNAGWVGEFHVLTLGIRRKAQLSPEGYQVSFSPLLCGRSTHDADPAARSPGAGRPRRPARWLKSRRDRRCKGRFRLSLEKRPRYGARFPVTTNPGSLLRAGRTCLSALPWIGSAGVIMYPRGGETAVGPRGQIERGSGQRRHGLRACHGARIAHQPRGRNSDSTPGLSGEGQAKASLSRAGAAIRGRFPGRAR